MGYLQKLQARQSEQGFTLVELAVVMIIIGILLTGVLNGQQLLNNARVAGQISQIKNIDAATTAFRDKYGEFPGDMQNAAARIAAGVAAGDGDGNIDGAPGAANGAETAAFWAQLIASGYLSSEIDVNTIPARLPNAFIGVGFTNGPAPANPVAGSTFGRGHYLVITDLTSGAGSASTMRPDVAGNLDRKIDDGFAQTGTIIPFVGGTDNCTAAAVPPTNPRVYNEANQAGACGLYVRFQN